MNQQLGKPTEQFFVQLSSAPYRLLMLDYDGTIAPFKANPMQATPYPEVKQILQTMLKANHTRIVIISGRSAKDLLDLLKLDPMPEIWGCHGWERISPDGGSTLVRLTDKVKEGLYKARQLLKGKGLSKYMEDKSAGIALLLRSFLAYDLAGSQTRRDFNNFIQCAKGLFRGFKISSTAAFSRIQTSSGHSLRVQAFPISIDFKAWDKLARSPKVTKGAWLFHENYPQMKIILGLDRLDYTKGISLRFKAYRQCLRMYPELHGKVVLIQVVVPSRQRVTEYQEIKSLLDELVGEIAGEFTMPGWTPIHYFFRKLDMVELASMYRTAEIALITPERDGMNLVAKEYCACSQERGVLILSEFAGAATQLSGGALLINPNDVEGTAEAIHRAFYMSQEEQRQRLEIMRKQIANNDVYAWVNNYLRAIRLG